jgi:hypothetical protein
LISLSWSFEWKPLQQPVFHRGPTRAMPPDDLAGKAPRHDMVDATATASGASLFRAAVPLRISASSVRSDRAWRSGAFSFSRSFRRLHPIVFQAANPLRQRSIGDPRHTDRRANRVRNQAALRQQKIDMTQLRGNLFGPTLFPREHIRQKTTKPARPGVSALSWAGTGIYQG